jgi:hypothetical protein
MSDADYTTMILLTYTPGVDVERLGYDDWLRKTDNPFFNTIPGIAHYSNWKVLDGSGGLPFTHFDLLGLDGPGAVEQVWFDENLDRFREGWVAKWGYGGTAPRATANGYGLLATRQGAVARTFCRYASLAFEQETVGGERWIIEAALHKHWALGPVQAGDAWRLPATTSVFGTSFGLAFSGSRPEASLSGSVKGEESSGATLTGASLTGECIAAPDMPWR